MRRSEMLSCHTSIGLVDHERVLGVARDALVKAREQTLERLERDGQQRQVEQHAPERDVAEQRLAHAGCRSFLKEPFAAADTRYRYGKCDSVVWGTTGTSHDPDDLPHGVMAQLGRPTTPVTWVMTQLGRRREAKNNHIWLTVGIKD